MTVENAQREPTMEEILASIRRIISEDEPQGGDVLELQEEPSPEVAPEPEVKPLRAGDIDFFDNEENDALEIGEEPEPAAPPPPAAPPVFAQSPPERAPAPPEFYPPPQAPSAAMRHDDALVSDPSASRAAGALGRLMGTMMVSSGVTLDDVVRELLKPMLRDWLDANLPTLVEAEVQKEIERIRRMAR